MPLRMWGQYIIQDPAPAEDPVIVGTLWYDETAGLLKVCTAVSPYTFTALSGGSGTVTSVSMTVPTGLSVSGSPITTSGTFAVTLTAGYMIPGGGVTGQMLTSQGASAPIWTTPSPANPFDQDLNTTDDVIFVSVSWPLTTPTITSTNVVADGSLPAGTYYLVGTSVDNYGGESLPSNEVMVVVPANGDVYLTTSGAAIGRIYYGSTPGGQANYVDLNGPYFYDLSGAIVGTPPVVSTLQNPSLSLFDSTTQGQAPLISAPSGTGPSGPQSDKIQGTTLLIGDRAAVQAWDAEGELGYWLGYAPMVTIANIDLTAVNEWISYGWGSVSGRPGIDPIRLIQYFTNHSTFYTTPATGTQAFLGTYTGDTFGFLVNNRNCGYFDDALDAFILPNFDLRLGTGKRIKSSTTTAQTAGLSVYDVNGAAYRDFLVWTNGDAPAVAMTVPTTGTLTIAATSLTFGTPVNGGVVYSTAAVLAYSAAGSANDLMRSGGAGAPTWSAPAALTRVDDTNVTLTLGGTPTTALVTAASITAGWSGQLSLARGGTAANLTAVLGGAVYSTASALGITAAGISGQVLTSQGAAAPIWTTVGGSGTVTSVAMTVPTGLSISGSPVTTSGTLAVTLTAGFMIPGGGSAGQYLQSAGASAPVFSTATLPSTATGTGTILRADGTNWAATTATYPTTITSGHLLVATGADVIAGQAPAALTRTDDTNVTLTLGGAPTTALVNAASITAGWTGTLSLLRGGTAAGLTAVLGGAVYSTGSALAITAAGISGQVLTSQGAAAPIWTTPTTGTVTSVAMTVPTGLSISGSPVTTSGTLAVTLTSGFMIPGGGSAGQVLQSAGASAPAFSTATYPATATGTGTILRADGTNWIASTATYPTTITSGHILIATGSNVIAGQAPAAFTKTDDTNVTATLGGAPTTAVINAMSLTLGWTGTLAGSRGGTGYSSIKAAGIAYGLSTSYIDGTGTAGTDNTAQTVKTIAIAANTLTQVGDRIAILAVFRADTGAAMTSAVTVNGVNVMGTATGVAAAFQIGYIILAYISSTTANITTIRTLANASQGVDPVSAISVSGFDWTASQDVDLDQNAIVANHLLVTELSATVYPKGVVLA